MMAFSLSEYASFRDSINEITNFERNYYLSDMIQKSKTNHFQEFVKYRELALPKLNTLSYETYRQESIDNFEGYGYMSRYRNFERDMLERVLDYGKYLEIFGAASPGSFEIKTKVVALNDDIGLENFNFDPFSVASWNQYFDKLSNVLFKYDPSTESVFSKFTGPDVVPTEVARNFPTKKKIYEMYVIRS